MKTKKWKKIAAIMAAALFICSTTAACGSSDSSDSGNTKTAEESSQDSEHGEREVFNEENRKVKITIPQGLYNEENLKIGDLEKDDNILYYSRFAGYRPDVDYSQASVSEMLFDVFIEDISEDVSDNAEELAKYLDVATVQLVGGLDDTVRETVEREEDETWNDVTYRVVSYKAMATDGTEYRCTYRMGVLNGCYVTFRTIEYTGSEYYVSYIDMSPICQEVYNSVKIINM